MSTPIILLAGEAGSGKDTVGTHIATNYNGICLGQADPMKRFCQKIFDFTEEQLWGPSEVRNAPVPFSPGAMEMALQAYHQEGERWVRSVVPAGTIIAAAMGRLQKWFQTCVEQVREHGTLTPRFALQTLGTEWGRSISLNMWNDLAIDTCKKLLAGRYLYTRVSGLISSAHPGFDYAVLTDGRFRNEIINTRCVGGVAFNVWRPKKAALTAGVKNHQSEVELSGIPRHFFTEVLENTGTLDDLFDLVDTNMAIHFGDDRCRHRLAVAS